MKYYVVKVKRSASRIDLHYRSEKELAEQIANSSKSLYPQAEVRMLEGIEEPFADAKNKK